MGVPGLMKRYPAASYFALTFAISWGGFLMAVGPSGFSNTSWQNDARFPLAVAAMLAGPSISGLLMTALNDGMPGLRTMGRRLLNWNVGVRWYAFALALAPILAAGVLSVLSLSAPIYAESDKVAVLASGVIAGFSVLLEEIGWTGFALPQLRKRYSILATGSIIGVVWGVWHLLQQIYIAGTYAGNVPLVIYLPFAALAAVAQLTAYRILLVWVYDRTGESLLMTTLMHASLTASTIFFFAPLATGSAFLADVWLLAAAFWVVVGLATVAGGGRLAGKPGG